MGWFGLVEGVILSLNDEAPFLSDVSFQEVVPTDAGFNLVCSIESDRAIFVVYWWSDGRWYFHGLHIFE